jgi:quercetin dioxygenase-like cupin family protein
MKSFSHFSWQHGKIADLDRQFPSYLSAFVPDQALAVEDDAGTHFGYVHEGQPILLVDGRVFHLHPGMYFSVPGAFRLLGNGRGIVITRENWRGFFYIGGPAEHTGRLKYIDGCTDSLLIPPVRLGDPCLNLLYFPAGIDQTQHTHPSDRIGMILSGRGQCITPDGTVDLVPGMIFCIHTGGLHSFRTPYGEDMRVLAYHPDSDFGPTDEKHPMINRTIVNGVSASEIEEIRTR